MGYLQGAAPGLRLAGIVGAVAIVLSPLAFWVLREGPDDPGSARDAVGRVECDGRDDGSYGATPMGVWLKELLVRVGMPRERGVGVDDVADTGTALEVDAYGGGMSAYVAAHKPPDPELSRGRAEAIGKEGPFTIYYRAGRAWKAFSALGSEWQLSLLLYPAKGERSVPWRKNDVAVSEWFGRALGAARNDPPPCS